MLIIFDKDNTLVRNIGKRPSNTLDEQVLFPDVLPRCEQLRAEGHTLAIASNQGGVAFGYITAADAHLMVANLAQQIGAAYYAVCVCHPNGKVRGAARESEFRKPNPGMLLYLMDTLGFAASNTVYVGDRDEDQTAAKRAHVKFQWADEFFERNS